MADFIAAMAALEARKAELDGQIKAAVPEKGEDEEGGAEGEDDEPAVDEAQIKEWKRELAALRKQIKAEQQGFAKRLNAAVDELDEDDAATLLLAILRNDMQTIVDRYVNAHRQEVIAEFESWWKKYSVTLAEIEQGRDSSARALQSYVRSLGYA